MNHRCLSIGLLFAFAVSCSVTEIDVQNRLDDTDKVFFATTEDQPEDSSTRTFTNESLRIFWHYDDRITVFNDIPAGREYAFHGDEGATSGQFDKVPSDSFVGSDQHLGGMIYAVYPHRNGTSISDDGIISYTLPSFQPFQAAKSFGEGASPMVAKTTSDDDRLFFKNVGGFLSFKLYGSDVSISSVILKSKNHEPLSGACSIDMSSGLPEVTMAQDAKDEVRIFCEDPVELASAEGEYTEFMFVLPPLTFENEGFTLIVTTPDGGYYTKEFPIALEIERSKIKRFAPLQIVPTAPSGDLGFKIGPIAESSVEKTYLSSERGGKTYYADLNEQDETQRSYILTIPTVTDFSKVKLDYELLEDSDVLRISDQEIASGTEVDLSKSVTLYISRGYQEKRFTLSARNTGLPVVRITTSFPLETIENQLNSQQNNGTDQRSFLPVNVENGTFVRIEYPDGSPGMNKVEDDGSRTPAYEVKLQIKGRGNATWQYPKKPYALKLDKKREVLGMAEHKRWILLANWRDRTLLRNDAAFWLSEKTNLPYTVSGQFVELEFNGVHRGNYYLCEQIKLDRIPGVEPLDLEGKDENGQPITVIPEDYTGGYLMEIDSYYDEVNKFNNTPLKLNYMFKEPDGDGNDLPATIFNYMKGKITSFEQALQQLKSSGNVTDYKNYLDDDSAIWFMLINEVTENRDFFQGPPNYGPHSTYLYKKYDKDGGKFYMGPVWDFDYETFIPDSYITGYQDKNYKWHTSKWRGFDRTDYYYHYLCYDKAFREKVRDLWNSKKDVFLGLRNYITQKSSDISLSQKFDDELWPYIGDQHNNGPLSHQKDNHDYTLSFDDAIETMISSFEARVQWMTGKLNDNNFINKNQLATQ